MNQSAALIVNGKSRRGREWFSQVESTLKQEGVDLRLSRLVRDPRHISTSVKEALQMGLPLVCVGGGDGTFSAISDQFIGVDSTLGVLPLGTGNSLARDIGIVADVKQAVDVLLKGKPRKIDLGQVNDRFFVNVATIGLTTQIAESLTDEAKRRLGRAVYLMAVCRAAMNTRPFTVRIDIDGERREYRAHQVVVGSGRYHGGPFQVTPDAQIDSGRLSGYVLKSSGRGTLLRYALNLWRGKHVEMPEVFPFDTESLRVSTLPTKRLTVDGEIQGKTPAEFRIHPAAIQVMAP